MPTDSEGIEQELLAVRCQLGEIAAFEDLVARWHTPMWQYVRRMADQNELADELIQETWLRVLRGIDGLREPASLVPWMFGIARRVMMDRLRQKYRQEELLENARDDLMAPADEEDEHERRDDIAKVLDKLENLPLSQRELLTLYYGAVQLCAAVVMLKRSQRRRHALLARRDELSSVLAQCGA